LHFGPARIFLAGALMTLGATFYSIFLLPDSLQRLKRWAFKLFNMS
jgi:hypothetical protein